MKKTYGYLLENEEVLWEDRPKPFKLLDGVYKNSLLTTWIIWGLLILAYLVLYIPYAISNELMGSNVIVISVVVGACIACVLARPFVDKNSLKKKTTYVLTNHRAIVVSGNNVKSMFINADTPFKIEKLDNGADIIMMGSATASPLKKSRSNSLTGIVDEKNRSKITGLIFYSVKNGKQVCDRYTPFKEN